MPPATITDQIRLDARARPTGDPVMFQTWSDLLFLHWKLPAARIQETLPPGLQVDTDQQGDAWLGLVPFAMSQIRPRGLFGMPWISAFLEMNVRTYVTDRNGVPGVYFYSLDAERWIAVKLARSLFRLPYFHASMSQIIDSATGLVDYECTRFTADYNLWSRSEFRADHEPTSPPDSFSRFQYRPQANALDEAAPGSLEFFLLERYSLFTLKRGGDVASGRVSHAPYRFTKDVELVEWSPTALHQAGFDEITRPPDHIAWAHPVDVEVFPLKRVTNS